jgi:two-component system, cell cycle sensor histidine kinase and response regulator CckA
MNDRSSNPSNRAPAKIRELADLTISYHENGECKTAHSAGEDSMELQGWTIPPLGDEIRAMLGSCGSWRGIRTYADSENRQRRFRSTIGFSGDAYCENAMELPGDEIRVEAKQLAYLEGLASSGRLALALAHDLANMIGPVVSFSELALRHSVPESRQAEILEYIFRNAQTSTKLLRQILRVNSDNEDEPAYCGLSAVVHESADLIRHALGKHHCLEIEGECPPLAVRASPLQIKQILLNLSLNAARAMPDGGIIRLTLSAEHDAEEKMYGCIRISDNGPGIPPEEADRIFEPFYSRTEAGGVGLGLFMVRHLAEKLGGEVTLVPVAAGACFRIALPAQPAEALDEDSNHGTVLVAEDEPDMLAVTCDVLESLGFRVKGVASLAEAEGLADTTQDLSLIVLDYYFPGEKATTLIQHLRERRPELPLVMVSAFFTEPVRQQLRDLGVRYFVAKPWGVNELARTIGEALSPNRLDGSPLAN